MTTKLQIAPDFNPKPYQPNGVRPRHVEPRYHLRHRLAEGIYA